MSINNQINVRRAIEIFGALRLRVERTYDALVESNRCAKQLTDICYVTPDSAIGVVYTAFFERMRNYKGNIENLADCVNSLNGIVTDLVDMDDNAAYYAQSPEYIRLDTASVWENTPTFSENNVSGATDLDAYGNLMTTFTNSTDEFLNCWRAAHRLIEELLDIASATGNSYGSDIRDVSFYVSDNIEFTEQQMNLFAESTKEVLSHYNLLRNERHTSYRAAWGSYMQSSSRINSYNGELDIKTMTVAEAQAATTSSDLTR